MNLDNIKPSKNVEDQRKRAPVYTQAALALLRRKIRERIEGKGEVDDRKRDREKMPRGTIFQWGKRK